MSAKNKNAESVQENLYYENLGLTTCSIRNAKSIVKLCFECGDVPVLISEAGVGKSQAARQIAKEINHNVIFKFLAHCEPEDIGGIPYPDSDGSSYKFLCEEEIQKMILSGEPTVLVMDEWNRGEKQVMNAAFTMMEDRMYGSHKLPDNTKIMACMNPSEGAYLVNEAEKDPAFRRRLCFIAVRPDITSFMEYARNEGKFHPLVIGFLQHCPDMLMDTKSREAGKIYASPASWEKISRTMYVVEKNHPNIWDIETTLRMKVAGHIGTGLADEFFTWGKNNFKLVKPEDVLNNYGKVRDRVLAMTDTSDGKALDSDLLSILYKGVATLLINTEPPPSKVAPNLGLFAVDLPNDMSGAFLQSISQLAKELDKLKYLVSLNGALNKDSNYVTALTETWDSRDAISAEDTDSKN